MTKFRPQGWPTIIPRIFTEDVDGLIDFLKSAFAARGQARAGAPAEIWIGDSLVMVSDGGDLRQPQSSFLYVYVENADETYQRALAAGAVTVEKPADMPYGDRRGTVKDPWGNIWQIATHSGAFG